MPLALSTIETRILGCLIEKERTGPEYYPLTINALTSACNQLTNRDPIVSYDEKTIEAGLDSLREKKLVMIVHTAGARVPKYRHRFLEMYNLSSQELAVICVLMLRGPQTSGEIRARIERLSGVIALAEVERTLEGLSAGEDPLACVLPSRAGQKERRYVHLFCPPSITSTESSLSERRRLDNPERSRLDKLEDEIKSLKSELEFLRAELHSFKKDFE